MRLVLFVLLAVWFLPSCTIVEIDKRANGSYTASLTRAWSDVTATIETPDGGSLTYSSDADTAAAMNMNQQLLQILIAGGRLAAPGSVP